MKSPTTPSDYRPISLTPIITRIMEKLLIKHHLSKILEQPSCRDSFRDQFAFRRTGSTTAALIAIIQEITNMLDTCHSVRLIALDFTKAFDTIRHIGLFNKLASFPINDSVYNWMVEYFSNHAQKTSFNQQTSEYKTTNAGIIQGSAIGPFAFVITASDLHPKYNAIKIVKYADDTYLIIPNTHFHLTNLVINDIKTWASDNNLTLNMEKSKEIILKKSNRENPPQMTDIKRCDSINILGVSIDQNLRTHGHIDSTLSNIGSRFYLLKQLKSFGLPQKELSVAFSGLILSRLTYAIQAWWGLTTEEQKSRIIAILRRCKKWGYLHKDVNVYDIVPRLDSRLFRRIEADELHTLHRFLPPVLNHGFDTRRAQRYNIPHMTNIRAKNFIFRHLLANL